MKNIRYILFMVLVFSLRMEAQNGDPVEWEFSTKAVDKDTYEVIMTAIMEHPWHIYSQYMEDGGPVPTTITFTENPAIQLVGEAKEDGIPIEKYEDVFMIDTRYYEGVVHFVQTVKVNAGAKTPVTLNGTVLFMACSDEQCLTPQERHFKVTLGQNQKQG
ncbi:sugar transporter [Muricauda sp. TY007]|uniref:protein-disulfide reductase DsbD domain-containing protein n=1 Tax=Allomuricauda sp. TY007 TaxID=2683200 RepID=UPI0013C0E802|nr:protein-disulfide reductase DsbD domain-containing protein [Muricauda sp. TY007]NDV15769.1 sugar transporter [Muricauda sp. TY007]